MAPSRKPMRFATTRWSLVMTAGQRQDPDSDEALAALCTAYWHPVYAFVRSRGHAREDAEDLTQGFFARVLEKNYLGAARRESGRFRSFLLTALKFYLANEKERLATAKRGGGVPHLPLVFEEGEEIWSRETSRSLTPERVFERRWALSLLERALSALRREYQRLGKEPLFDGAKGYLVGGDVRRPYREVAGDLEMTEGAVKVAVHRLRRRYGELLRREIAQTVVRPEETEEELRHLLSALSAGPSR